MTATVHPLFQSPPAQQADDLHAARTVLFNPLKVADRDLRTACHVLISMGDADDYMMAQVALLMLDRGDLQPADEQPSAVLVVYTMAAAAGLICALLWTVAFA